MKLGLGLGFGRSGGSGYYILLGGVYGGAFDETTGEIGVIGTATSNLTGTLTWSIVGGGDADISINSSTGAVSSARAIYSGDSAVFTVQVTNGTLTIGFPFIAVGTYRADSLALFARMTTQPDATRKEAYDTFYAEAETSGVLAYLDFLYIFAAHDEQAACLNLIADQYNATPVNSPTFVADGYYQGNGTSSYLDTGFNPTTAVSPKFAQNTALIGVWSGTNSVSTTAYDMGQVGSTQIGLNCGYNSTNMAGGCNANPSQFANTGSSIGNFLCYRTDGGGQMARRDGTYINWMSAASSAPGNSNFSIMRRNTTYSSRKMLAAYAGRFGGNQALFDTALRNFLTTVGAI